MAVYFTNSDLQSKIEQWVAQTGRSATNWLRRVRCLTAATMILRAAR